MIDDFNREALWIEVDTSLLAQRVIRVFEMIATWRGYPNMIRSDNGPELISNTLAQWADKHHVLLDFIAPGKPTQNAYIEQVNRTSREEVLDLSLFHSLAEVRDISDEWMHAYNAIRHTIHAVAHRLNILPRSQADGYVHNFLLRIKLPTYP